MKYITIAILADKDKKEIGEFCYPANLPLYKESIREYMDAEEITPTAIKGREFDFKCESTDLKDGYPPAPTGASTSANAQNNATP